MRSAMQSDVIKHSIDKTKGVNGTKIRNPKPVLRANAVDAYLAGTLREPDLTMT